MNRHQPQTVTWAVTLIAVGFLNGSWLAVAASEAPPRLWYNSPPPANDYMYALPLGNGRVGVMVYGSVPEAAGTYLIDWEATFSPVGKDDVRFGQNSYGGFALRMAAECRGDAGRKLPAWTFGSSEGRADINGRAARWVPCQGTAPNGQSAGVAIFDHPTNPRHPSLWQT